MENQIRPIDFDKFARTIASLRDRPFEPLNLARFEDYIKTAPQKLEVSDV